MNMLVIGNGFDLAHGRPTRYEDFLKFARYIYLTQTFKGDATQFEERLSDIHPEVKAYILNAFEDRMVSSDSVTNKNKTIQEMYECLYNNAWYCYFCRVQEKNLAKGKDWVDFESEIRTIVSAFDQVIDDLYEPLPSLHQPFPCEEERVLIFWAQLDFTNYNLKNKKNETYKNTFFDLIQKTYQDLENLIRCLEIYLDDCVGKISVKQCSPDIDYLEIKSVLSFNYTSIPTNIYPSLENVHYIHGHADANRPVEKNNMVLGVNEYWSDSEKNVHTNFNLYKKFVQRIIKETGIDYKNTLQLIKSDYMHFKQILGGARDYIESRFSNIYIFGHSLDVTDGDILREIIQIPGVVTTIFYRHKQQQADQIANLSKVLGQDELLERTVSTTPTIIFKRQADMVDYPSNE